MSSTSRIDIRLSDREKKKAQEQADKLGLTISEYFRLIVNLDAATNLIRILNEKSE